MVELLKLVSARWNENIGSESRTARMSDLDVLVYANELLGAQGLPVVAPGDTRVVPWMAYMASTVPELVLVRLSQNDERKHLLVNTAITQ